MDRQHPLTIDLAAGVRHRQNPAPSKVITGQRAFGIRNALGPAGVDDMPAILAGVWSDVHQPVRRADRVLIVLDDDQGIPQVAEVLQGRDQPGVIPLMQPNRRLIQHVENARQARTNLGRQADTLRFATG